MGCCLMSLTALLVPRVVLIFIWFLTDWFTRAFETTLWPVLGFLFMPYTTLAYMGAMLAGAGSVSGWWLVLVVVAVLVDLGNWSGGGRSMHKRGLVIVRRR